MRDGAGDNVFGMLLGKIRGLAEALGTNHGLGVELWATGNHEARVLSKAAPVRKKSAGKRPSAPKGAR